MLTAVFHLFLEHENANLKMKKSLTKEHETLVQKLRDDYEGRIREMQDTFAFEKKELVKKQNEALDLANEQHYRELEATKQELIETHMEKFTSMTEELDKSHQVIFC